MIEKLDIDLDDYQAPLEMHLKVIHHEDENLPVWWLKLTGKETDKEHFIALLDEMNSIKSTMEHFLDKI